MTLQEDTARARREKYRKREGEGIARIVRINIGGWSDIGELAGAPYFAGIIGARTGGVHAVCGADAAPFGNAGIESLYGHFEKRGVAAGDIYRLGELDRFEADAERTVALDVAERPEQIAVFDLRSG